MANEKKTVKYSEPSSYFPKNIRKKQKLGEYAETKTDAKSKTTANNKKK